MSIRRTRPTPRPVSRALEEIGDHARTWRKLRGLTAAQVADRAGVDEKTLRALEHGDGSLSLANTLRILRALGMVDVVPEALDPYATDVGRLRADEHLPERVRPKRASP